MKKLLKILSLFALVSILPKVSISQAIFTFPDTVCVNETVNLQNVSSNGSYYSWNFCVPNVNNAASAVNIGNPGNMMNVNVFSDMAIDHTTGNYHMFVTSYTARNIVRLDFGNSPLNVPTTTNLGTFAGVLPSELEGIQIAKDGANWYGFVVGGQSVGAARLVRLNFGTSLTNVPTATNLGNIGSMQWSTEYQLVKDGANWIGLVANRSNNRISIHDFGTSLANTPTGSSYQLTGAGNAGPCNLMAIKDGANWHVFVTCLFNSVVRLDYGNSLLNAPVQVNFGTLGGALNALPRGIIILKDCNQYVGYLGHENGITLKLNFNAGLTGAITTTNLGNLTGTNQKIHEYTPITHNGNIHIFTADYGTNTIQRMNINFCTSSPVPASNSFNPPAYSYPAPGTYDVSLIVDEGRGIPQVQCSQIVVLPAPTANITSANITCNGLNNGNATVNASGGTPNYTYNWSTTPTQTTTTINNLSANTYTVTVTDINGCTSTSSVTITQPALLTSSITSTNVSCFGGNNGTATVTPTGGTTNYNYAWSTTPVQTSATATGLIAGTYTVTVTDANNCTTTSSVTITEPTLLTSSITGSTNVSCYGGNNATATVNANGGTTNYSYSWNSTPTQSSNAATSLIAGTYIVTVTDANGCTSTSSVIITEPTQLATTISSSTNVTCNGLCNGSATAVDNGGGTPAYSYSWNSTPVQNAANAINLCAGTYTCTITDANGCTATASVTINEPTALAVNISSSSNVLCFGGNTGSATANASGGTTGYSYSWSTTPIQTSSTAANLIAGTYTVTVTDANNCTATATAIITEPTLLVASISGSTNVSCFGGNNGAANAAVNGGTASYNYSWSTSPVQNNANATGLSIGTYTVTVTDANSCTATATVSISEPTLLVASVSASTNVSCFGGNNGTANAAANGGTAPYNYSWNTSPVQNNANATSLSAGTYTVTITDANGCTATATITITEPTQLVASISTSTNVSCFNGNNGTANATAYGGTAAYSYSWSTSPVQTNANATGLSAGTYTVTVTDANNCYATATIVITQPTQMNTTITSSNVKCNGQCNGIATATSTGGITPYAYSWSTSPIQNTAIASSLCAGSYTVTTTDNNGCTNTSSVTITQPAVLASGISNSSNVTCNAGNNGFANINANGGTSPYSYSWSGTTSSSATASNLSAGTYTATVTDANGCTSTSTAIITQPTAITAVTSFIPGPCDRNNTADVVVNGGTPGYTYSWNTNPIQTTATATNVPAGNYIVTVTDNNGCTKTQTLTITNTSITPTPAFSVTPISASVLYDPVFTFTDSSANANIWDWDFGDGDSSTIQNPTHIYADTGKYCITLTVTNLPSGCKDSTTKCVTVEGDWTFFIPNSFTPNEDGINDMFEAKGMGLKEFKLYIFDRWGNMIFESDDIKKGWDGKANGGSELAQMDVYVYKIILKDVKGKQHNYIGSFSLIR